MKAAEFAAGCLSAVPVSDLQTRKLAGAKVGLGQEIRILSVSSAENDAAVLREMLDEMPLRLSTARTCREAAGLLSREQFGIVLCECALEDGTWIDILNQLSAGAERPLLIVTARLADESLWAEVLNLGGYDLLATPFRQQEVRHVLTSAWVQRANPVRSGQPAVAE